MSVYMIHLRPSLTRLCYCKCLGTFTTTDYIIKTESVELCIIPASWYSIHTTLFLSSTLLDHIGKICLRFLLPKMLLMYKNHSRRCIAQQEQYKGPNKKYI